MSRGLGDVYKRQILGLAALLHTSAIAFQTMKYLGVAYLLYMAWMTLKEHGALKVENQVDQKSVTQVIVHAILINILNPKLSIFFFAFLPQFVSTEEAEPVLRMSELSAVFMLMTFVVFVAYGLFAAAVRRHVISRPSVMTWSAGRLPVPLPRWAPSWRWRIDEQTTPQQHQDRAHPSRRTAYAHSHAS